MAIKLHAFVAETSTTTGLGTIALNGAITGHRTFGSVLTVGDITEVAIRHDSNGSWAHCTATYSATNQLTLTTIESSTGSPINWASGGLTIVLTPLANRILFLSQTFTNPTFAGAITESVYALSGTTPVLEPDNGTIQTWTLTGNSTPTDGVSAGQVMTLMIDDGASYTITWPTLTWLVSGGTPPTLATTGYTTVVLWKVGTTLYGKY